MLRTMTGPDIAGYSVTRRLANGGMTNLFVGVDAAHQRVVLRKIRPEFVGDRNVKAAFQHGAQILARLDHPNVVRMIKTGLEGDTPYMVVEYVDGSNMRELLLHHSALLKMNPLTMMRQMAAALSYVHLSGFLHLDFKPENLIVRTDGLIVLIDFDLAMERKPKPMKLSPLPGTFAYLPPETINKGLVDEQTDIYAFGVSCYELLSGHKPFEGVSPDDSKRQQLNPHAHPKVLRQHNVHVSMGLERVIFKCLAHHQHDRYPSMSLVQRDLETIV